jgi:serine/threonine protein kinase/Tfp pilus assembly protein PilF
VLDLQDRLQDALSDRYDLQREIGRGGMATVYLAQDRKHRRPVALKILHPTLGAQVGGERFQREVEIAARLNHPHILTLIDSGEAEGFLYYVMPYVHGESLRARLTREHQLPLGEALQITRDVASALGYAHGQGVVHRDVKPENVMLHEGVAMVADFGICKALSTAGSETLTQTGTALGTPAYMSPEQASGDRELDGRSDLYSLGCMLYEMLAGEPPFTGPNAQATITRRFTEPVPSVRAIRPNVSSAVEMALTRVLARSPADRFSTAEQFSQALAGQHDPSSPSPTTPVAYSSQSLPRSIAVLPFADMSPEKDQDYFCEGIAEEIINALTRIQALRVASRSSAFAHKGKSQDIRQVGEQLGVGTVLEGSVRKAGSRLRITSQLINVADGYHLWSERYDRELEDVFAVQDEIAENIVRAMRLVLSEREKRALEKPRTENVEAYEYYLRGRQFFHQFRQKALEFARRMFARSIELDPNYVLAHAGVADCSSLLYHFWDPSEANLQQANAASLKALQLGPEVAEARVARGLVLTLTKEYEGAEREFEAAIRLDPQLFDAHYFYARVCFQQGKLAEAARLFEQASAVRPEDYQAPGLLSMVYRGMGREEDAQAARRREAQILDQHLELNPDDVRPMYLKAITLAYAGEREKALELANRALALDPTDSGVLYNVGCAYALLGLPEESVDCLQKALDRGYGKREWIRYDSDLDSLRDLPRFKRLLEG